MWEMLAWFVLIFVGFMLLNTMWVWLFIWVETQRMNDLRPAKPHDPIPLRKTSAKAA